MGTHAAFDTMRAILLIAAFVALASASWFPDYNAETVARLEGKQYSTRYSGAKAARTVTDEEKAACHGGIRGRNGRLCNAYSQPVEEPVHLGFTKDASGGSYGWLADECFQAVDASGNVTGLTWESVNKKGYS